ncbi:hypothetical protein GLOIN_2v1483751 [Rhizophagus clarus]|uniref:BAH domain-containing protein n=1 Tax=Rhizophagus clarus TaxID=94130 RepID=A0A8H3LV15_9GLOM|nr:hypothetical protein GLOIN_2v1483751 [Rhizophagus clarus]
MPKQPTFEKIYPTLRKPLGLQKKSKFIVTLREKNNLSFLSTNVTSNIDFIINSTITSDSNFINNYEKAVLKHIFLSNIHVMDHNNINNSYIQDNLIRNTEDNLREFNLTIYDDISLDNSKSTSTNYSFSNNDDEYTNSYTDVNSTTGHRNYYDMDSKFPEYTGDSDPYFPSLTAMWIFIWFTKKYIGIHAYHELVKIICHPKFEANQVPYSITTLKKIHKGLPLLPFTGKLIPIDLRNTPSKTLPLKETYTFSIKSHIYHIINNPTLMPKMYFGPGVKKEERTELWHGNLWKESPLFGEILIVINNSRITGIVITNESIPDQFFRIQLTRTFHELPGTLKSNERYQKSQLYNELWLEESRNTISVQDIIHNTSVWIKDDDTLQPSTFEFSIQEIFYTFNGRQKVHHISLRHKLPVESIITPQLPPDQNIKHFKFFIDLYFDDFGAFNKAYHKLGGLYIKIGNMNKELRKKLRNHFLIGFVPFGGEFKDVIEEFISDMKELQAGIPMIMKNEQVWVRAGFGMNTANLPQGNDMAGVKRHNVKYGCRTFKVPQNQLSDTDFDIFQNGQFHHLPSRIFDEIKSAKNISTKRNIAQEHGLCLSPNILDDLACDRHLQTPQDPFHCLAGLARRLFDHLFNHELEKLGLDAFHSAWITFEIPRNWKHIQSPITHLDSYWMSDSLRLVMIIPFILARCLNTAHLKQYFVITVKNNLFANKFCESDYQVLDQLIIKLTKIWNKIYPDIINTLPNVHVLRHLPSIAANFGTLQNISISLKEMMHGVYKRVRPHTNKKKVEFDLIKRDNILQGLRYVIDNGYDARFPEGTSNCIKSILKDEQLICLLKGWYISAPSHHIISLKEYDMIEQELENEIESPQECFFNVRVHKKWDTKRIKEKGFVKKINNKNEMQRNLYEAYRYYLNKETAISFKILEYYDMISYTILQEDDVNIDISIHVGDDIDILVEDDNGIGNREYALIKGIFTHKANDNKKYAFFILDWYYDTGRTDGLTGCKIYGL